MEQYAVNLHAPYTLIRAVLPIMQSQGGGRILNVTTGKYGGDAPITGVQTPLAYPSSKAALDQFCISVAPQLAALGISITNVNPGFVRTEMVDLMSQAGVDSSQSVEMDVPTRALAYLATCDDPMDYTGQIRVAEDMVREFGL